MATDEPAGTSDPALTWGERAELEWLREENALLRTERDILIRVATGFAEDTNVLSRYSRPGPPTSPQREAPR